MVANFAAEVACQHNARLILQHVIRPQERAEILAGAGSRRSKSDLLCLVPTEFREQISIQTIVVPGDPTESFSIRAARSRPTSSCSVHTAHLHLPPSPVTAWFTRCWHILIARSSRCRRQYWLRAESNTQGTPAESFLAGVF